MTTMREALVAIHDRAGDALFHKKSDGAFADIMTLVELALSAPPADSNPDWWVYEKYSPTIADWEWCATQSPPDKGDFNRNITPLYAHPPAESIDACIREAKGYFIKLSGPYLDGNWDCTLRWDREPITGKGPTPLAALQAALAKIAPSQPISSEELLKRLDNENARGAIDDKGGGRGA